MTFYLEAFLLEKQAESSIVSFTSHQVKPYKKTLFSSHDSTPGPDTVRNQLLQHLNRR